MPKLNHHAGKSSLDLLTGKYMHAFDSFNAAKFEVKLFPFACLTLDMIY